MSFEELFTDPAYMLYMISLCLFLPFFLISVIAQIRVQTVFAKYSKVPCSSGITAQGYARNFLLDSGLNNITFKSVRGSLTDHFDPTNNTIALSDTVRESSSVGAIGVACHEAGHAVQHARKYFFSTLRIKLVPVVNAMSGCMWPLFIIGYIFGFANPGTLTGKIFIGMGLAVMGASLLFSLVTLPTEFDASRRAYAYLKGCMLPEEARGVKKVLRAAAWTYIASFMMTSLQFIRLLALLMMSGRKRR